MFARGNCGLSGESMTASLMHLLVHLRILNWIVVNSPRLWNKGLSRTYAEVLTVILKYRRMWYDEIESNRNKDTGNGLSTLNGQSEPFHSELKNSEWIKSPQVGFEPTTSQLTADRSTTELLRKNSLQEADSRSLDQPMTDKKNGFVTIFHIHREKGLR